ncbi:unnamed protein product [Ostreobium quekettii]|uniref:LysM domain-containing protein n=1 Tax=Ostreobium quekettii TaxID=121088 RepID=A0A8S1JBN5_9CHLO|nr:unnamed protein product [Ostreobium quekettii]
MGWRLLKKDSQKSDDGTGTSWVIEATMEAKRVFPGAIITHAPQAPYFTPQFTANYVEVEKQVGTMIDFYNIQFYNQASTSYDSYAALFERSGGWSAGSSVMEISDKGVPLSKIVVGKPVTRAGVVNSGFVEMSHLATFYREAASKGTVPRGFMGWQWSLDARELGGRWAQTLGAAWSGVPNVPKSSPSPSQVATPTAPSTESDTCTEVYTVVEGDSLWAVGQQYGVEWQAIFEANKDTLPDGNAIHVGQQLRIPVPCDAGTGQGPTVPTSTDPVAPKVPDTASPAAPSTESWACFHDYTVVEGDSLWSIGQQFGVEWPEIFDSNTDTLEEPSAIYVGQHLRIPTPCGTGAGQERSVSGPVGPATPSSGSQSSF